jgi:subtilisin family serine protease
MHYTQKGLSFLIVLTLCIQPVFAEELIPEETNLPMEAPTEPLLMEVTSDLSVEVTPVEEVESTNPEVVVPVSSTEFISASIKTPLDEVKTKINFNKELPHTESAYVDGEILVKYKDSKIDLMKTSGRKAASRIAKSASLELKDEIRETNISILEISDTETVEEKIDELENNPNVEYAQPNFVYTPSSITPPNDPSWMELWGLDNQGQGVNESLGTPNADINVPEAWAINEGTNASVIVAIIDTGVAYNHPDLHANMWDGTNCKNESGQPIPGGCNHGYDYEENDVTPLPSHSSHGTHIAGTIAAVKNNTVGISGVAPSAKIMALKTSLTTDEIVKSIQFATQNGAQIINASWVGPFEDPLLKSAIAAFPGLLIAAAGNTASNNETSHIYPSDFDLPNILSVAATDQNDNLAYFSNFGAISVDVGAPGVNIYSTVANAVTYSETFEDAVPSTIPDGWTIGGDQNSWGTYDTGMPEWGTILFSDNGLPYSDNVDTTITSPTLDMRATSATMNFWTGCDTEYDFSDWTDYLSLEYSADGVNFNEIFRWDELMLDFLNGEFTFDETSGALFYFEDLSIPTQYLTNNFKFQFRWHTDESVHSELGCAVDDIQIVTFSDGTNEQYEFAQGTSMAAPHVAGLAALIEGYNPNLSSGEVKEIILSTGDAIPSLAGNTVTGMRINAEHALRVAGTANALTTFTIPSQTDTTVIHETDHTVSLHVPFGTNVTSLVPVITITGGTVTPASGVPQDFTSPVVYTVTGLNGSSTQDYIVTVLVDPAPPAPPVVEAPRNNSGGGGGGGGGSSKKKTKVSTPVSVTPLTSAGTTSLVVKQTFTLQNSIGSRNAEVTELQKILITKGFLTVTPPTGYFGTMTQTGLMAYQRAHGIPQTGIVDEATRAKLNGSVTTSSADAQRVALIKVLQAKLLELLAELKKLKSQ